MSNKINLLSLSPEELQDVAKTYGQPSFRGKQIFGWLSKGISSFDEMTNVPQALRASLERDFYIGIPKVVRAQESQQDGTVKCLLEFEDGARVETVFMKYSYGNSICISSQVGCRMGCKFCASTMNGLTRNLEAGEMLGEVLAMRNYTGEEIRHIVIMGIGEPFDNYDNVSKFLKLVNLKDGYNLSMRNITVSTCGIVPMIEKFGDDFPQVNLAVSLHAPNDEIRSKTMPIAKKYDFDTLLNACKEYTKKTGRRISFEYSMIDGVNDSLECAEELARSVKGWLTHINLIPLNKVEGRNYNTAGSRSIREFKSCLEKYNIAVTVRRTLGQDIDAACGQLRNNSL